VLRDGGRRISRSQYGANVALSRRVAASNGAAAYLVPARGGVCATTTNEVLCNSSAGIDAGQAIAIDMCSSELPIGQIGLEWLVPDGATSVRVSRRDGSFVIPEASHNVFMETFPIKGRLPNSLQWNVAGYHISSPITLPRDLATMRCIHPSRPADTPRAARARPPFGTTQHPRYLGLTRP
jgi:hypothetical protein